MRFDPKLALALTIGLLAGGLLRRPDMPAASPSAATAASDRAIRPAGSVARTTGTFQAEVLHVVDGDTLEARVTVWLGHALETRVRLRGIDAAELSTDCPEERELALASRAALQRLVAGGRILLTDVGRDKYAGRVVATVLDANGANVGAAMLRDGYAIAYDGGRRQPWCGPAPTVTARR